ncbi:hypothetical protein GCM10009592_30160 [Brachybacterium rhamnosum]
MELYGLRGERDGLRGEVRSAVAGAQMRPDTGRIEALNPPQQGCKFGSEDQRHDEHDRGPEGRRDDSGHHSQQRSDRYE